jgi:hypothetical protein
MLNIAAVLKGYCHDQPVSIILFRLTRNNFVNSKAIRAFCKAILTEQR